jgi:hypothetical protein
MAAYKVDVEMRTSLGGQRKYLGDGASKQYVSRAGKCATAHMGHWLNNFLFAMSGMRDPAGFSDMIVPYSMSLSH